MKTTKEYEKGRAKAIQLKVLTEELETLCKSGFSYTRGCESRDARQAFLSEIRRLVTELCEMDGLENGG